MGVENDSAPRQSHLSADDLNDGFILDKEDRKTLAYQVNKKSRFLFCDISYCACMFRENYSDFKLAFFFKDGKWNIGEDSGDEKEDGDDEDEGAEEEEGEGEEEEGEGEEEEAEDEEVGSEEEEEDNEEENEDGHSDLESVHESDDETRNEEEVVEVEKEMSAKSLSIEEIKAQQDAAKAELPYTFPGKHT